MSAPRRILCVILLLILGAATVQPAWAADDVRVSMEFNEAPIQRVFESLAAAAGLNVLLDQSVQGKVTLVLRDQPVMQAIALIAQTHGLRYQVVGNAVVIASPDRIVAGLVDEVHDVYRPRHADLASTATLIRELFPEVRVILDDGAGRMILQGLPSDVERAVAFLARLDVPQPQAPRTLNFVQTPVEDVLLALAERAGWNLILAENLDRPITASLDGMEPDQAVRLIADVAGLEYRLEGSLLIVDARTAAPVQPDATRVLRLDYGEPQKALELVRTMWPEITVAVDAPTRTLVLDGPPSTLAKVEEFLDEFDAPPGQVLVEARVEEISVDAMQRLGLEWSLPSPMWEGSPTTATLTWNPLQLRTLLEMLHDNGESKVLASPKLAALDGKEARILIGDRIPIIMRQISEDGEISETIEYIEAGISLEIIPSVGQDGFVTLDITTEVSSITGMTPQNIPQTRTREAVTRVRVRDGQPLAIGGLIQEEERVTMTGLPFLKDLPLVGRLFRSEVKEAVQSETVIFLIPRIVHDEALPSDQIGEGGENGEFRRPLRGGAPVHEGVVGGAIETHSHRSLRLDVNSALAGAAEVEFEQASGASHLMSRMYLARDEQGLHWGYGVGVRRYIRGMVGRPWMDVVWDRVQSAPDGAVYTLTARVGGRGEISERLYLEPYLQYAIASDGLTSGEAAPGRQRGISGGFRLGWQY